MSYKDYQLDELFNMSRKNVKPNDIPEEQFLHYSIPAYDNGEKPLLERGALIKSNKYLLKEPSILVSKLNPRINRVWKFDNEDKNKINSICSTEFMVYERKSSDIDLEYYYQFFKSKIFQRYLLNLQSGSTGSRMRVSPNDTLSIPIPKPTKKQQQKIAAILSSVDEAIEKTEQIIEQTETVKKGLVQQLLTKGTEHMEFKNSPIGVIPKSWSVKPLEDLVIEKPSYGSGNSAQDYDINKPRYIRITDITEDGYLNENEPKSVEYKGNESYLLKDGDFLFARTGNTVGKSYMYQEKDGFAVYAGYLIRFRVNKSIIKPKFIFHLTHSNYYYNWVKSMIRTGAQPNINAQEYSSFLIPIPSIEEQDHIINIFSKFEEKIFSEQQQLEVLENIKKGLMQQLLTGKVRVQIDENEEIPS